MVHINSYIIHSSVDELGLVIVKKLVGMRVMLHSSHGLGSMPNSFCLVAHQECNSTSHHHSSEEVFSYSQILSIVIEIHFLCILFQ